MQDGDGNKEDLGVLFSENIISLVPPCTVEEETVDVASIFRLSSQILAGLTLDFKRPAQSVNSELVLASIVLQGAREEGLREVEAWQPIYRRRSFVDPCLEEREAPDEIIEEN